MQEIIGDIFDYLGLKTVIAIPTNGCTKENGEAVTGAGLAKLAAKRFSEFPRTLGKCLRESGNNVYLFGFFIPPNKRLINVASFPTKYHWRINADIELIEKSAIQLVKFADKYTFEKIYLPRVGCGLGGLDWDVQVRPVLDKYFDERFIIVNKI